MAQSTPNKSWLNSLALVSGILGVFWLIFDTMTLHMMHFYWEAILPALTSAVPLLTCLTIALKWRRTGGALLIIYSLLWPIYYYIVITSFPNYLPLTLILHSTIRVSPSYLVPGILFLVSRSVQDAYPPGKQSMSEIQFSGIILIGLGALISFVFGLIFRVGFNTMLYSISAAILSFGGLFLLVFAVLARPGLGGIIGISYAVSMLAFILIYRLNGRALALESLKNQFIPSMLLLIGSIMVLCSAPRKRIKTRAITQ